ncbi:MAG: hypothetical protein U5O39_13250 [Gammaproteobacteria bacterium]|nr:hypothetical protein [Gammaproteobacteria bacterium]
MATDQLSFKRLIDIGIALSAEKDTDRLMETILLEAKDLTAVPMGVPSDIRSRQDELEFKIVRTDLSGYCPGRDERSLRSRCSPSVCTMRTASRT